MSPRCERARGTWKLQSDRLLLALPLLAVEKEEKEEERDDADGVLGLCAFSSYARRGALGGGVAVAVGVDASFAAGVVTAAAAAAAAAAFLRLRGVALSRKRSDVQALGRRMRSIARLQPAATRRVTAQVLSAARAPFQT